MGRFDIDDSVATLDGPNPFEGLGASIGAHLEILAGNLGGRLERIEKQVASNARQPILDRQAGNGTLSAAGGVAVEIRGGPPQGTFWYVRQIVAGGLTRATACAGIADVYVASSSAVTSALSLLDLRDSTNLTTLPGVAFYGRGEIVVHYNERLWVVFSGGTAGQQVIAAAGFEQYQEAAHAQDWAV